MLQEQLNEDIKIAKSELRDDIKINPATHDCQSHKKEYEELKKHRIITLRKLDQYKLFLSDICLDFFACQSKRMKKHQKMLDIGRQKLLSELDMCKIIKDLRAMKLFMENQWAD